MGKQVRVDVLVELPATREGTSILLCRAKDVFLLPGTTLNLSRSNRKVAINPLSPNRDRWRLA